MSNQRDLRIGLAGAGSFGTYSAMGLNAADGVAVTSVFDLDTGRAEAVAKQLGGTAVSSYAELVDSVDMVYVATPPKGRPEMLHEAIAAGKHVFSQKPLGLEIKDVEDVLQAAEKAGVIHALGHQIRYHPVHRYVRKLVQDGFLGEIRMVEAHLASDYATTPHMVPYFSCWNTRKAEAGGFTNGHLTHYIDSFRFMFGDFSVKSGTAYIAVKERPLLVDGAPMLEGKPGVAGPMEPSETDDTASFIGELASGGLLSMSGGWAFFNPSGNAWNIYGSEGTLTYREPLGFGSIGELRGAKAGEEMAVLDVPAELRLPHSDPVPDPLHMVYARELHAKFNDPSTPTMFATFADAVRNEQIIEAIVDGKPETSA